jgi:hypothetical protein
VNVRVAPLEVINEHATKRIHWHYFVSTLREIGVEPEIDTSLGAPSWASFEFCVNGRLTALDYSDFVPLDQVCRKKYKVWFKRMYHSGHKVISGVESFPPCSFHRWRLRDETLAKYSYDASGETILHKQVAPDRENPVTRQLRQRRLKARKILTDRFGDRVDVEFDGQRAFFEKASQCLVSVHIPGSWEHSFDRGQHQLMGLGVCTVSPDIQTFCLEDRPQPWFHYVPIRDDYLDLAEMIEWCMSHREECQQIGQRAKQFFESHSSPSVIWAHVQRKVNESFSVN